MFIDTPTVDFLTNQGAEGPMAERLNQVNFDPGLMRPWIAPDGQRYCDVRTNRMVTNKEGKEEPEIDVVPLQTLVNNGTVPHTYNTTALQKDVWERIDRSVLRASRDRLRAFADLRAAETYGGFNGMAITSLIRDTMTDPGEAKIDMDGISEPLGDRPLFTPDIIPLPVTHCGFYVSQRVLAQSRNSGTPIDTTMAEACGRRVAETIEKMTIGTLDLSSMVMGSSNTYANRGIYGFITQPDRITKTDITASGSFVAETFVDEVLVMRDLAYAQKFYGPFILYTSTNWDQFLDRDYWVFESQGGAAPTRTVRDRVKRIEGIMDIRRLDFLTDSDVLILVQMTSDTVRAINGMEVTTVQWDTRGGLQSNFQVMAIQVPDLRSKYIGTSVDADARVCGIVHGTTS